MTEEKIGNDRGKNGNKIEKYNGQPYGCPF